MVGVSALDECPTDTTATGRLAATLVRYETGPDRWMLRPVATPADRVETEWIAVDEDTVRSVAAWC